MTLCQAATQPSNPLVSDLDAILRLVLMAATVAVTVVFIPWLREKGREIASRTAINVGQKRITDEQLKMVLSERAKKVAIGLAERIANENYPALARDILSGDLKDKDRIKARLYQWGEDLEDRLIEQMEAQSNGQDVVEILGKEWITTMLDRAADTVSPFPGKEASQALLDGGAKQIVDYGVGYVRTKNRIQPVAGAPPLPPGAAAVAATITGGTSMAPYATPPAQILPEVKKE